MFLLRILILSCMFILYIVEKNFFCCYCLQVFSTKEISKCHFKVCFKINGKQRILIPKKGENVKLNNYERKIKSPIF